VALSRSTECLVYCFRVNKENFWFRVARLGHCKTQNYLGNKFQKGTIRLIEIKAHVFKSDIFSAGGVY
jgi:hypothetical protein